MYALALKCRNCGAEYELAPFYVCRKCLGPLEVKYSYEELKLDKKELTNRVKSIWRYRELLPINESLKFLIMDAGFTPLRRAMRLAEILGLKKLYIKDDTVNPTGSFKDRPASIAVCKSIEFEFKAVGCASTGNLAAATASYAAKAGIPCYVFIPSDLEMGKILQIASYNPVVIAVKDTYDIVNRLATQISELHNIAVVNVNLRPYYVEGSKTPAFEVCEQLEWTTPDYFIIPMGSGALLCAINRGLKEMEVLDLMRNDVKLVGVQPEGCSPIVSAFKKGMDDIVPIEKPNTIVKSLAIGDPAD
ncbi:threonine synthase, partial [Candidatus Bathyarchaeota archaeon]|nr:threonine synthase [Candidatus Bathyarchaeota archaeon]